MARSTAFSSPPSRLEAQGDGVLTPALADLRAAIRRTAVPRPAMARRSRAARAAARPARWTHPPTRPGRGRPAARPAPAARSTSCGASDSSAPRLIAAMTGRPGRPHAPPHAGARPGCRSRAPWHPRSGRNGPGAGADGHLPHLRSVRRAAHRRRRAGRRGPSGSPHPHPAPFGPGLAGRAARAGQSWRARPPIARLPRSQPGRPRLPPIQYVLPTSNSHGSVRRWRTFSASAASIDR